MSSQSGAEKELVKAIRKYLKTVNFAIPEDHYYLKDGYPRVHFERGIWLSNLNIVLELTNDGR